jgi:hypothetical protein
MPTLSDLRARPQEKQQTLLELGRLTLDVMGPSERLRFPPDQTAAVVSLFSPDLRRKDPEETAAPPAPADPDALDKVPGYVPRVEGAIAAARNDAAFAAMLRPMLGKLMDALNRVPAKPLSPRVSNAIERLREAIAPFVAGPRAGSSLDLEQVTDDILRRVLGSTKNVGRLPRQNVRTIVEFFAKHDVASRDLVKWAELVRGVDLHAVKAVDVITLKAGELVAQYVETTRAKDRQVGEWMVRANDRTTERNLGLSGANRARSVFRVKKDVKALRSKAAPAADHWTEGGTKPHVAVTVQHGQRVMKSAEQVAGGAEQYFVPSAWTVLERS